MNKKMYDMAEKEIMMWRKPEKLIVHCSYHKVATLFFGKIFRKIAKKFEWKFQTSLQGKLNSDTSIFMQHDSQIDFKILPPYVGSHIIRDPRDMIISGYFYHLWCSEKWCQQKKPRWGNKSYQEVLNSLPQEEGIILEIRGRIKGDINNMIHWNYSNPHIIEIRLEDLAKDERNTFAKIFEKYGFNSQQMEIALSIVEQLSYEKRTGRQKGEEDKQSHFRKGVSGDWKNNFTDEHKKLFKELYPGVLAKLGYEQDDNW